MDVAERQPPPPSHAESAAARPTVWEERLRNISADADKM